MIQFEKFADIDAEKNLIAACILDSDALVAAREHVAPGSFYRTAHQKLFRALIEMDDQDKPVDVVSLIDHLGPKGTKTVGGEAYISEVMGMFITAAHVVHHAHIIAEHHRRRTALQAMQRAIQGLQDSSRPPADVLARLDSAITKVLVARGKRGLRHFDDIVTERFEQYDKLRKGELTGVSTGFRSLNASTGGFNRKEMAVLAGRPGTGKSALALNMATRTAREGHNVAFFSLEMSEESLADRVLASESSVDNHSLRTGWLEESDWERLSTGLAKVTGLPFWIMEDSGITSTQIRAECRRLAKTEGLDMVIVDYLGLLNDPRETGTSESIHLGQMTKRLRAMLRDFDGALLLLHQLNRDSVRDGRPPRLHDLRGSGEIEQDADIVMFLHPDESDDEAEGLDELVTLHLRKNRHGPTGRVPLYFKKAFSRFTQRDGRWS